MWSCIQRRQQPIMEFTSLCLWWETLSRLMCALDPRLEVPSPIWQILSIPIVELNWCNIQRILSYSMAWMLQRLRQFSIQLRCLTYKCPASLRIDYCTILQSRVSSNLWLCSQVTTLRMSRIVSLQLQREKSSHCMPSLMESTWSSSTLRIPLIPWTISIWITQSLLANMPSQLLYW